MPLTMKNIFSSILCYMLIEVSPVVSLSETYGEYNDIKLLATRLHGSKNFNIFISLVVISFFPYFFYIILHYSHLIDINIQYSLCQKV